jgi:hypothetical protein
MELADVPTSDLMREVQRRLDCTLKPKKHLILVGAAGVSTAAVRRRRPARPPAYHVCNPSQWLAPAALLRTFSANSCFSSYEGGVAQCHSCGLHMQAQLALALCTLCA